MQSLSAIMSLAANLEEYQAQREQRQTEQRFKELSNEAKGDPLKTADLFESRYGDFGTGRILREKAGEIRQQAVDQMLTRVGDTKNPLVQGGQLLKEAEAHPALWPDLRGRVVDLASKLDPRLAQEIPEQYDQARVRGMLQFVEGGIVDLGATEQALKKLKAAQEATKNALERDKFYRESAAHWFSTPKTREQWEQVQQYGASMGIPATILQEFGEWSPDAPTRANEKLLTPEQRKMAQPTTIQAAILGARQRGDDGEVKELLALQQALLEEKNQLKEELARMKAWEEYKKRYTLINPWDGHPAVVSALRESRQDSEPAHWIYTKRYDDGRRTIFQPKLEKQEILLVCHTCKTQIHTGMYSIAPAKYVQD